MAGALRLGPDVRADLAALVSEVEATRGARLMYRHERAFVGFFPGRGYSLTLQVEKEPPFEEARFLTLTRLDDALRGELLDTGTSEDTASRELVEGTTLTRLLEEGAIELGPIDAAYLRYYADRAGPRPRPDTAARVR